MLRTQAKARKNAELGVLQKKLLSVGNSEKVHQIASRLFQRIPFLLKEMDSYVSENVAESKQNSKMLMVDFIMDKIMLLVEPKDDDTWDTKMPGKLCHYISYVDLLVGILTANSKQWVVHLLKDYPKRQEDKENDLIENEGYSLRSKLKYKLREMSFLPDVQAEVRDNRIWLRIAMVKQTTNRVKDRANLEKARRCLVVYFPGEPYFYATTAVKKPLRDALCACLGCGGWEELPLQGHHVDGLRRMRLGRDARDGPVRPKPNNDRFCVALNGQDAEPILTQPQIGRGTWTLESEFKGGDVLQREEKLPPQHTVLQTVVVAGQDVISGLLDLPSVGVLDNPPPPWVTNFSTAGRNEFVLDAEAKRVIVEREAEEYDRYSSILNVSRNTNNIP